MESINIEKKVLMKTKFYEKINLEDLRKNSVCYTAEKIASMISELKLVKTIIIYENIHFCFLFFYLYF